MSILTLSKRYFPATCRMLNSNFLSNYSSFTRSNTRIKLRRLRLFSTTDCVPEEEKSAAKYEVTFIKKNGDRIKVKGKEGDSLLDLVVNNSLDFEGYGACEGTLTCSTCHVILKKEDYDKLPEKPSEEEMDMLDLAHELTDTSRLGCQIILSKDLDGLEVQLPSSIMDARQ